MSGDRNALPRPGRGSTASVVPGVRRASVTQRIHVAGGWALAIALTAGIAWLSRLPMGAHPSADAVLRVAWSARPERIEECRQPTRDELAALPAHMRQRLVCEGTAARYRLEVRHAGRLLADQEVRGGGLRGDRRLYVFRDLAVPAGEADVAVRFTRIDSPTATSASNQRGEVVPPMLVFERRMTFDARRVAMVTYSGESRALVATTTVGE